jgi:APA family basic amino acid/polyamine antiporter
MTFLPVETWERLAAWMLLGLIVYAVYGRRRSRVRALLRQPDQQPARGGTVLSPAPALAESERVE